MHKKAVPNANRSELREMVLANKRDSDFDAWNAKKHLFGKKKTTREIVNNIGFVYGSPRAIQFGNCAKFPVIVEPSYSESEIIG